MSCQRFNIFKWKLGRLGAGVIADKVQKGVKKTSPAQHRQSKQYKDFADKVQQISGVTASVWDFSNEGVAVSNGVELIHPDVYIQPVPAVLNYNPGEQMAGEAAGGNDEAHVELDALIAEMGADSDYTVSMNTS